MRKLNLPEVTVRPVLSCDSNLDLSDSNTLFSPTTWKPWIWLILSSIIIPLMLLHLMHNCGEYCRQGRGKGTKMMRQVPSLKEFTASGVEVGEIQVQTRRCTKMPQVLWPQVWEFRRHQVMRVEYWGVPGYRTGEWTQTCYIVFYFDWKFCDDKRLCDKLCWSENSTKHTDSLGFCYK